MMRPMTPALNLSTPWSRHLVRQTLAAGGVIAYPTEAVWGLGCDPWNEAATHTILDLKNRPEHKGLILVASSVEQIRFLLSPLPEELQERATRHWPGPVTCVIPDVRRQIPPWVRGQHKSIAVRISAHPLVKALCELTGGPLVSTSCNPAGRAPARHAWQVQKYFPEGLDLLVAGRLGNARKPSTIIDIVSGQTLR